MGLGGISAWQLIIVLVIVIAIFGTKRFKNIGSDLGGAVKGFKNAIDDGEKKADETRVLNESEDATFESTPSRDSSKSSQS